MRRRPERNPAKRLVAEAQALGWRDGTALLRDAFDRNDLLTYASAISFQLLFAFIPLALFALGLLGGSGLQDVWTSELAPEIRRTASPAAFHVLDDTVHQVFAQRQLFWISAGAVLAAWELSGALRAVMSVLDRVYEVDAQRSFVRRMTVSLALGLAVALLLILTAAAMEVAPRLAQGELVHTATDIGRWPVAVALLWCTVTLVVHVAPAQARPVGRVTFGSTVVILAWLLTSSVFAWYLTHVANYGSIFGALGTVVVALTYLYASTIALLTGVQLDALVQRQLR